MKQSIGLRCPARASDLAAPAVSTGGTNAQCTLAGGTPGFSPDLALAPWSIQASISLIRLGAAAAG